MRKKKGVKIKQNLPKRKSRRALFLFVGAGVAVLIIAGGLLIYKKNTAPGGRKKDLSGSETIASKANTGTHSFQILVGKWRRPDGGYIIEILGIEAQGKVQAGYFNPRPINVSQARAEKKDGKIHVFIELRDRGYPGATYSLVYDRKGDVLAGLYYQPTAGRSYDVVFARMPSQ